MMATTQPEDIPQTIRSRCQHFSFHAVKFDDILAQLRMIASNEDVVAEDAALALLAEAGDGSMRDALSIMDQAIASAPTEDGKAVLSSAQIRELMGAVPNAVFERLLEAVAAGQSAELMEQLNLLVNAGHSPSSLARQMVRYLRNCLMAKIGGAETELLQISGDERARAARTALLFTEEEITRNLQIVLRTFDDLNYRQEQRFHLELGLLKLIHAQRLLPLEELLSGISAGGGVARSANAALRPPTSSARPPVSAATAAPTTTPTPAPAAPQPLSPFGPAGGGWGSKMESGTQAGSAAAPVATMERPAPAPVSAFQGSAPFPAAPVTSIASGFAAGESMTEGALAKAPLAAAAPTSQPSIEAIRHAVGCALVEGEHLSAAQLLGAGVWGIDGSSLRIEVAGMGKKMLALTVNAAAEKIIRQELQRLGAPSRFLVVPGEGVASSSTPAPMAEPLAGSIQEAALANPLVKRAKEIFNAEVRSVVDMRQK
jgi:DNA polymerase-3 subunit gamma/tau